MPRRLPWLIATVAGSVCAAAPVQAGTLDVSPVLIDVVGTKASATSLNLRNRGTDPVAVQLRVFRWRQENGADVLEPTSAVSASPPFAKLPAGAPYVVRLVRTDAGPIVGEETYRLLIDELPRPQSSAGGNIQLAVRYSLPVFFRTPMANVTNVSWTAETTNGSLALTASNRGSRRARIANLRLIAADGTAVSVGSGLAGYALGQGGHRWTLALPARFVLAGAHVEYADEQGSQQASVLIITKPLF